MRSCPQPLTGAACKSHLQSCLCSALAQGIQGQVSGGVKAYCTTQSICSLTAVPMYPLFLQAGGGNEPLLQEGDSSFTSAKSVESFASARSRQRDMGETLSHASACPLPCMHQ